MDDIIELKSRIRLYARRYYLNLLFQRLFLGIVFFLFLFLIIQGLEYLFWLKPNGRIILFLFYLIGFIVLLTRNIIIPLFRVWGIIETLHEKDFADRIGVFFPDIQDKIRNILELSENSVSGVSLSLLNASIRQKYENIRLYKFERSINWGQTKRMLPLAIFPIVLLVILGFTVPDFVKDPLYRITHFNQEFSKPAPFRFVINNKSLDFAQNADVTISVSLVGSKVPDEVFLLVDEKSFRMDGNKQYSYDYTLKNVRHDFNFSFKAGDFQSEVYRANVFNVPTIVSYVIKVNYPAYINKPSESFSNITDLIVPHGTKVELLLLPRDADGIDVFIDSAHHHITKRGKYYVYNFPVLNQQAVFVSAWNKQSNYRDSLVFNFSSIPDVYPEISVSEKSDSLLFNNRYFMGRIKDDYGISALQFRYRILDSDSTAFRSISINLLKGALDYEFYHYYDFNSLGLSEGQKVEYYFIVWDNDFIGGPKSSRSVTRVYKNPTREEVDEMMSQREEQLSEALENARKKLLEQQLEIERVLAQTTGKRNLNYEERENIKKLSEQQAQLQNEINELVQQNAELNKIQNEFNPYSEELLEKQQQVDELFNQLASEEMEELLKRLNELMEQNKKGSEDVLQQMQMSNEDILKQLERQMELGKSLAVEKEMEDLIKELNLLSEKQNSLSENNLDDEAELEQQQEINEKFEDIENRMDSLLEDNGDLEMPFDISKDEEAFEQITDDLNQSEENLESGNSSKASKSQKSAAQKMQDLAQKMSDMKEGMNEEQLGEDIGLLRELLESLIKSSFVQESLIGEVRSTSTSDPMYYNIMRKQKLLLDGFKTIEDSLFALSKRQPMISNLINDEIGKIEYHSEKVMSLLQMRAINLVVVDQQYVMTSVNNLALLLAETLKDMQNSMNQQMSSQGSSQCKKGGKSKGPGSPSARTMRQLQEQLNQQIQELGKKMEQGKTQGQGSSGFSEELAKLAAQQEALRKMMEEYNKQLQEQGINPGKGGTDAIEKMEQTETDLVNKRITLETLLRQQDILTRLLESEKAEQEREKEERRESEEAKFINNSNPESFFKYNTLNQNGSEVLMTIPPSLNGFYRKKINEYFYKLQ